MRRFWRRDRGRKISVDEMIRISKEKGRHFFDATTMQHFGSEIHSTDLIAGRYFITSEKKSIIDPARVYTVRGFDSSTGEVKVVGEFGAHESLEDAERALDDLVAEQT